MATSDREALPRQDERHACALVSDFLTPGWRASCSCGWEGAQQDGTSQAEADFRSHVEFEEAAGRV